MKTFRSDREGIKIPSCISIAIEPGISISLPLTTSSPTSGRRRGQAIVAARFRDLVAPPSPAPSTTHTIIHPSQRQPPVPTSRDLSLQPARPARHTAAASSSLLPRFSESLSAAPSSPCPCCCSSTTLPAAILLQARFLSESLLLLLFYFPLPRCCSAPSPSPHAGNLSPSPSFPKHIQLILASPTL